MERVDQLAREQMRSDLPAFRPGDTVEVYVRIVEGDKRRSRLYYLRSLMGKAARIKEKRSPVQ